MTESTMRKHMKERFGKVFNYSDNPPLPRSLNIELNNHCNQSCIFCPFHGKYAPKPLKPVIMEYDIVQKILTQARELGIGKKEVGFYFAGEAFLYKDLANVIKYAKELGFKYTFITSNGALASPDKMKAVLDAGIDSIRFSVNAADKATYEAIHGKDDFETVLNNIKYMKNYIDDNDLNVATSLSCVITKKTLGIQEQVRAFFGEHVDDILFIPVILERLNCDEEFIREHQIIDDRNAKIDEDFICPLLFDTMYINAELEVIPCCEAPYGDNVFYDLKTDFNLKNAWNCEAYRNHRNIFLKNADDKGTICEDCLLRRTGVNRLSLKE